MPLDNSLNVLNSEFSVRNSEFNHGTAVPHSEPDRAGPPPAGRRHRRRHACPGREAHPGGGRRAAFGIAPAGQPRPATAQAPRPGRRDRQARTGGGAGRADPDARPLPGPRRARRTRCAPRRRARLGRPRPGARDRGAQGNASPMDLRSATTPTSTNGSRRMSQFHSAIYALSGNPAIGETVAERWPHFKRSMGVSLSDPDLRTPVWSRTRRDRRGHSRRRCTPRRRGLGRPCRARRPGPLRPPVRGGGRRMKPRRSLDHNRRKPCR